jgi:hypothetical protein
VVPVATERDVVPVATQRDVVPVATRRDVVPVATQRGLPPVYHTTYLFICFHIYFGTDSSPGRKTCALYHTIP